MFLLQNICLNNLKINYYKEDRLISPINTLAINIG